LLVRESGAAPEGWWGGVARAAWVLVPKRARASPRGIGGPEACARRGVETRPFFYAVHTMPPYRARRFVSPPPHTRPPPPLSAAPPRAPRERPEALLAGGAGALARPPLLRTKPELWRVLRRQPLTPLPPDSSGLRAPCRRALRRRRGGGARVQPPHLNGALPGRARAGLQCGARRYRAALRRPRRRRSGMDESFLVRAVLVLCAVYRRGAAGRAAE